MARLVLACDSDRCIECNACVVACKNEHGLPWGVARRRVVTLKDGQPGERSLSLSCLHCTDPPCAAVCPTGSIQVMPDGVVLHDKERCTGCGYCLPACPFGAPRFPGNGTFGARGTMDKCTYCHGGPPAEEGGGAPAATAERRRLLYGRDRLGEGKLPLCAEMCATKALLAGDAPVVSAILAERVARRGYGAGAWGWAKAYGRDGTE